MKTESSKSLPKTAAEISNGGLYQQAVRCGKTNCRCASGDLHKGYYYFIGRVNGRQRKTYVPKQEVEAISKLAHEARDARQAEKRLHVGNRNLISTFRTHLQCNDSVIKNLADLQKEHD
jgi:hypothetical protein